MASQEEMWNLAGLLGGLHSFSGRSGPQPGMAKTMFAMGQQARADAQRKQRQEQVQALLGQAPKIETMPQAGPMRPGEARPELTAVTQGSGLLGGQMAPAEFYGGLLSVPGMEEVGAQGLLQSMQPQQASWKLAEVGTEDGRMQRVAYNAADPTQMRPLGNPYEQKSGVTVNTGGTDKFNEELAKLEAKRLNEIYTQGADAEGMLADAEQFESLLGQFDTGALAGAKLTGAQLAQAVGADSMVGVDLGQYTSAGEAMKAIADRYALKLRKEMPGQLSDKDIKFLRGANVSMSNTPEGNRLLLKALNATAKRKMEKAQMAEQWAGDYGRLNAKDEQGRTFNQMWKDYIDTNSLFEGDELQGNKPPQQTRTLGGKSYIKIDGQWYEQ